MRKKVYIFIVKARSVGNAKLGRVGRVRERESGTNRYSLYEDQGAIPPIYIYT